MRNELDAAHNSEVIGVLFCGILSMVYGCSPYNFWFQFRPCMYSLDVHVQKFNVFWLFLLLKLMSFCHWSIHVHVCTSLDYVVDCASLVFGWVGGNPLVGVTKALPFWYELRRKILIVPK